VSSAGTNDDGPTGLCAPTGIAIPIAPLHFEVSIVTVSGAESVGWFFVDLDEG
jgi:hypothetical protein